MDESQHQAVKVDDVVKIEEWAIFILITSIPIINLFLLIYFSFKKKINQNKKNFARATLIYVVIMYILFFISWLL